MATTSVQVDGGPTPRRWAPWRWPLAHGYYEDTANACLRADLRRALAAVAKAGARVLDSERIKRFAEIIWVSSAIAPSRAAIRAAYQTAVRDAERQRDRRLQQMQPAAVPVAPGSAATAAALRAAPPRKG